ncbi:TPA: hypothetical protein I6876_001625 [Vibrio cholerae]|nr:hypothetical protein [Vibrio cholerae]
MAESKIFPTYIYPLILALILIPIGVWATPHIQDLFAPEKEVFIQLSNPQEILTSQEVGNRKHELFGQKVANSYITSIELTNIGKTTIEDYLFSIDVDTDEIPSLFRIFYTTVPPHTFGKVEFSNVGAASKKIIIDRFIEGNQLNISVISSELLKIKVTPNTSGVKSNVELKEVESSYTNSDLGYVAIFSALFAFMFRVLYDFIPWLICKFNRKPDV